MAEAGPVTASDTLSMSDAISGPQLGLWLSNAADDLNAWAENLVVGYGIVHTDDINNWGEAQSFHSDWVLSFSDTYNNWLETLTLIYQRSVSVNDTLSFSDAATIYLLGSASINASDSANNLSDSVTLQSDWLISFYETLDSWQDDYSQVLEILLTTADNLDNLSDEALSVLLAGLTASVSSNLNSWDDRATNEFLSRLSQAKRANLVPYIRRYLNDVERPTVHEIHLGVGDNVGNWNDSVS